MQMKTSVGLCAIAIASVAVVSPAIACATLDETPHPEKTVAVTDESAVIIWDEANRREHFIRAATFKGAAKDIGFIVPSPGVPQLARADKAVFHVLRQALVPKEEERTRYKIVWSILGGSKIKNTFNAAGNQMTDDDDSGKTSVNVLQHQTVAGYDATTIKANDPEALRSWLKKNGYVARADMAKWLEPYVRGGWVVTAFKIRGNRKARQFDSALVRMSFGTEQPFYPYREPQSAREGLAKRTPRSLRIFFLGSRRMEGAIGKDIPRAWPGEAKFSDTLAEHLDSSQQANLAKYLALPAAEVPPKLRMTSYEDYSYPRPGFDDLYFQPSPRQETLTPSPFIHWREQTILIPLDLIALLGCVVCGLWVGIAGRRKKSTRPS